MKREPQKLPTEPFTRKLVLQLRVLQTETSAAWAEEGDERLDFQFVLVAPIQVSGESDNAMEIENAIEIDSDSDAAAPAVCSRVEEGMNKPKTFSFSSVRPGKTILVGYEEDFFKGEIETIVSPSLTEVNFIERCTVKGNTYCLPVWKPDRARVHFTFVLASDIKMRTTNGRIWTLLDSDYLGKLYCHCQL